MLEQGAMCPQEYLSEHLRPHKCGKAMGLAASAGISWVLALSSDLARALSNVFEAGAGPDGAGSQETPDCNLSALIPAQHGSKGNTEPSSATEMPCCLRALVCGVGSLEKPRHLFTFWGCHGKRGWLGAAV